MINNVNYDHDSHANAESHNDSAQYGKHGQFEALECTSSCIHLLTTMTQREARRLEGWPSIDVTYNLLLRRAI